MENSHVLAGSSCEPLEDVKGTGEHIEISCIQGIRGEFALHLFTSNSNRRPGLLVRIAQLSLVVCAGKYEQKVDSTES
jgi:hypothetical protein